MVESGTHVVEVDTISGRLQGRVVHGQTGSLRGVKCRSADATDVDVAELAMAVLAELQPAPTAGRARRLELDMAVPCSLCLKRAVDIERSILEAQSRSSGQGESGSRGDGE